MKHYLAFLICFLVFSGAYAQSYSVEGRVVDASLRTPLAFVNIVVSGSPRQGTTADIDGKFKLTSSHKITAIELSYVGYQPLKYVIKSKSDHVKGLLIKMKPAAVDLQAVEIHPGVNPALRIVRLVVQNRDKNNPEKMHSFSYTSYNKMYVTADMKQATDTVNTLDSSQHKSGLSKLLDKQYLFMMESVSKRNFLYPDKNHETVIANRTSGLKSAPFSLLATQMQSFSFYNKEINVMNKPYLNPITKAGLKRYDYLLEDTVYSGNDTVFVVSFHPKKHRNFDGMKGQLYINTNGYAIQNVIASPVNNGGMISVKIQQKYAFIDHKQWFPVQLNTDWIYNDISVTDSELVATKGGGKKPTDANKMKAVSRSYIKGIVLDPPLKKKTFNNVVVTVDKDAAKKDEAFWNQYRQDSLTAKEKKTYQVVDSVGAANHVDAKMKKYESLFTGKYPIGFVDIDLDKLLKYNDYEGLRLGLGLSTNDRLSRFFSIGGYGAYGFKDKAYKYGSFVSFLLNKQSNMRLRLSYINDVVESGGVQFMKGTKLISNESIRNLYIRRMDKIEKETVSLQFRTLQYLTLNVKANNQLRTVTDNYQYGVTENGITALSDQFYFTEIGLGFRYAYKENFIQTPFGLVSKGTNYPIVKGEITQGLNNLLDGAFNYTRCDLKIDKSFHVEGLGTSSFQLLGGYIRGNLPYTMLYAGRSSFGSDAPSKYPKLYVAAGNTFETMRMNEFLSNQYAAIFFKQNFGAVLVHIKKFNPQLAVVSAAGFGSLNNAANHFNVPIKTMNKGYYESGLEINELLQSGFTGMGLGAYYRYGPYAFPDPKDNLALKLTVDILL